MPAKRKSRGRTKGRKGRSGFVQCSMCGQSVPKDKVKKVSRRSSLVDRTLARELSNQGAYISSQVQIKYYCVSCAVHRGIVKVRSSSERKSRGRLR